MKSANGILFLLLPLATVSLGCHSGRTVPLSAFGLLLALFITLSAFTVYVLAKFGAAHLEVRRLQSDSTRGVCLRIGTIEIDADENELTLNGWTFCGGFTGYVIHGYPISELEEMQDAEIDRVARAAVSEVGQ
jgi:hypothetical protein